MIMCFLKPAFEQTTAVIKAVVHSIFREQKLHGLALTSFLRE